MSNYVINKEIDLSDEFDELTNKNQKEFIKDKFDYFTFTEQKEMLDDILGTMPNKEIANILKDAFDGVNKQEQADLRVYQGYYGGLAYDVRKAI